MEIVQERLEREYGLELISSAPTVIYEVMTKDGNLIRVDNPSQLPDPVLISEMREPIAVANILVPQEFIGNVITLCVERRGTQKNMHFSGGQVALTYELPLSEVVMDVFDKLMS